MSTSPDGSRRGPFWSVFEQSQIPMALVDRDRRYVAINDAGVALFQYSREEVIGLIAGRTAVDADPRISDAQWEQLFRSHELYSERVLAAANGSLMRVSYAAHTTTVDGRWLALFVTLSAQVEPGGAELITAGRNGGPPAVTDVSGKGGGDVLTRREREVVRHVALGLSTRRIAANLYLSPATVRSHVRNAMVKTGAHTRAQLVAIVLGDGLIGRQPANARPAGPSKMK
jgi:PAS domain S-box-containing protein